MRIKRMTFAIFHVQPKRTQCERQYCQPPDWPSEERCTRNGTSPIRGRRLGQINSGTYRRKDSKRKAKQPNTSHETELRAQQWYAQGRSGSPERRRNGQRMIEKSKKGKSYQRNIKNACKNLRAFSSIAFVCVCVGGGEQCWDWCRHVCVGARVRKRKQFDDAKSKVCEKQQRGKNCRHWLWCQEQEHHTRKMKLWRWWIIYALGFGIASINLYQNQSDRFTHTLAMCAMCSDSSKTLGTSILCVGGGTKRRCKEDES